MARVYGAIFVVLLVLLCVETKLIPQRNQVPDNFVKLSLANPDQLHEFRIALKQRNLNILEVILIILIDPRFFGFYLTPKT